MKELPCVTTTSDQERSSFLRTDWHYITYIICTFGWFTERCTFFFNSLSPKGYKINPYFTHICEHCSTKSPSIHWVFQKVALTTGGQTQANAVHVIQPLNSFIHSSNVRSVARCSFGSSHRRQTLRYTSGGGDGLNRRSPPLVFLREHDHGRRRNAPGFWIKTATIFKHCLQNETGTCKFNGPSLFEKLKLCSAVSLPVTCPLVLSLTHLASSCLCCRDLVE